MRLLNVEEQIKLCKEYLEATNAKGTEIESVLTKYLLVYIYGAYEKEIREMITKRTAQTGDKEVEEFVKNKIKRFRTIQTSEIKGEVLGKFSNEYKSKFHEIVGETEAETRFNNIVINRHSVAHGVEINITFDELLDSYSKAEGVLDAIKKALGIAGDGP